MPERCDVSVVIGFKDWGEERLLLSVQSLMNSFGTLRGEVIVSDYGSTVGSDLGEKVRRLGARYVYTSTEGVWSRSRALNAGFAESIGSVLVSTDADMLFTPLAMDVVGNMVISDPNCAAVLQCRDLPERFDSEEIQNVGMQWDTFESVSTLRPRWGMGGMMAVHRDKYLDLRGFDERMEIYGGEDMDFAYRIQRNGCRLLWVEDQRVRMYHMWHAPTRNVVNESEEGRSAISLNREITLHDKSFVRNTTKWLHKPQDAKPLASVVISTRNRAEYLGDSINSVLMQTSAEDLEIVIIDDGSEDETEQVVNDFEDARIRYFKRPPAGIAAARNFAATVSRSNYTVIHDDDDLMTPDRIERHFSALEGGNCGTYGGWIDFQNEDGRIAAVNPGKDFSLDALLHAGRVLAHATLMLPTSLIRSIGYDELLRSGSDYNLAVRLGRSGVALRHTGHMHLIRRLHKNQVTMLDSTVQKASARLTSSLALSSVPADRQNAGRKAFKALPNIVVPAASDAENYIRPYLPDHLVYRWVEFSTTMDRLEIEELREKIQSTLVVVFEQKSDIKTLKIVAFDVTLNDLRIFKTMNVGYEIYSHEKDIVPSLLEHVARSVANNKLNDNSIRSCTITIAANRETHSAPPDFRIEMDGKHMFGWTQAVNGTRKLREILIATDSAAEQFFFVSEKEEHINWEDLGGLIK